MYHLDADLQDFSIQNDARCIPWRGTTRHHLGVLYFIYVTRFPATKKKQSHYRPGQTQSVPGVEEPRLQENRHIKLLRFPALPTGRLYPRKYSWYSFLLEAESAPGPQCGRKDYVNEKFPVTPSGIEPEIFRLVAQFLNQMRHRVLFSRYKLNLMYTNKKVMAYPAVIVREHRNYQQLIW